MSFGGLNEIVDSIEKFGGHQNWKRKIYLQQFLHDAGGIDLGFIGGQYTWDNRQKGWPLLEKDLIG